MPSVKDVLYDEVLEHRQIAIREADLARLIGEESYKIESISYGQRDKEGKRLAIFNLERMVN